MNSINIALIGCGNVGLKLLELVHTKKAFLLEQYHLQLNFVVVADSSGAAIDEHGLDVIKVIETKKKAGTVASYPEKGYRNALLVDVLKKSNAQIVIEAGVTNIENGGASLEHAFEAIQLEMNVVFLSKGPIVCGYQQLRDLALEKNVQLKYSGATAAALPTIDLALQSLAGTEIQSIEGLFNGTTNYILDRMTSHGVTYQEALLEAQEKGIAETDPTLDVDGWDTAAKILILANAAMKTNFSMKDLEVTGITKITPGEIDKAKRQGKVIKLIGEVYYDQNEARIKIKVSPKLLSSEHPLSNVKDALKGVHFLTDTMGELTVIGGKSDPKAAAAAALKDIITITSSKYLM